MKVRSGRGLLLLFATALIALSAGCPNSTVIGGGSGTVELQMFRINQGRWTTPLLQVVRIQILPTDPQAAAAVGSGNALTLTPSPVFFDMRRPEVDASLLATTNLAQGTYEVVELALAQITFVENPPNPDPATCASFQTFYSIGGVITITDFPTPLTFTVAGDQDRVLTLTFDTSAVADALNASHVCTPSGGGWSISNFNPMTFGSLYDTYLTLE